MAVVTAVLANHSPHLLRYTLAGGPNTLNIDAAGGVTPDLLTDSAPGPLHDLLATAVTNQATARTLAFGRPELRITFTPRDADADWSLDADWDALGHLRLAVTNVAADGLGSMLNIEFVHSASR